MDNISASDIDKISASQFKETIINGKTMKGQELKDYIKKIARGGKTFSYMENSLKESGMTGSAMKKRQAIMGVLGGNKPITKEQKRAVERRIRINVMESRRSSELYDSNLKAGRANFANTGSNAVGVAGSRRVGIGIGRPKTGFAGQPRKPEPPKIAPSTGGGGGSRPIGL